MSFALWLRRQCLHARVPIGVCVFVHFGECDTWWDSTRVSRVPQCLIQGFGVWAMCLKTWTHEFLTMMNINTNTGYSHMRLHQYLPVCHQVGSDLGFLHFCVPGWSLLRVHLGVCIQPWDPQNKKDVGVSPDDPRAGMSLLWRHPERHGGFFSQERKRLWGDLTAPFSA